MQAITVRLDDDLYEQLRVVAFEKRRPQNSIMSEALRTWFMIQKCGDGSPTTFKIGTALGSVELKRISHLDMLKLPDTLGTCPEDGA